MCIVALPVLIKGACNDWPAMEWNLDNLKDRVGDNKVYVRTNTQAHEYHVIDILLFI